MRQFLNSISTLFFCCTVLLLSSCEAPKKDNQVVYNDRYNRTLCDFKSRAEFDDFVAGLRKLGYSYRTEYINNLPCEGNSSEETSANGVDTLSTVVSNSVSTDASSVAGENNLSNSVEENSSVSNTREVARPVTKRDLSKSALDTLASNTAAKHQYFAGNVGRLLASYNLAFEKSGAVSGSYYYNKNPKKLYSLRGRIRDNGELNLIEYTNGT